tara:strand:+ start:130 stop:357 length:228 start_codon:yes stop_codon:yes gene_type:complete
MKLVPAMPLGKSRRDELSRPGAVRPPRIRQRRLFPDWHLGERPMRLLYYRDRRMTPRLSSFISFATSAFATPKSA